MAFLHQIQPAIDFPVPQRIFTEFQIIPHITSRQVILENKRPVPAVCVFVCALWLSPVG